MPDTILDGSGEPTSDRRPLDRTRARKDREAALRRALFLGLLVIMFSWARVISASPYGAFLDELNVKLLAKGKVELLNDFRYRDPAGQLWIAPTGFVSDGASIPRILWSLVGGPLDGDYRNAAVIHDQYCSTRERDWGATHEVFYFAMKAKGVGEIVAQTMYYAVMAYGPRWTKTASGNDVRFQPAVGEAELQDVKAFRAELRTKSRFGNPAILNDLSFATTRALERGDPLFPRQLRHR